MFDTGIYRVLRPRGPLDSSDEIDGAALETLVMQHIRAINDYGNLGYDIAYWRTRSGLEVDFVLYGERGLHAIEVKRAREPRLRDLRGLKEFLTDYPMAKACVFYGGKEHRQVGEIGLIPFEEGLRTLADRLA